MSNRVWVLKGFDKFGLRAVLAAVFVIVCASSFNGYFSYSGFRETGRRYNLTALLAGTAHQPFVYRHLVPEMANRVVDALPDAVIHKAVDQFRKLQAADLRQNGPQILPDARLTAKYYFVYYATFLCFVFATYILYLVCWSCTGHRVASLCAALVFALIFPLFMTDGGFFYDHWELLFFGLAYLIALRGNAFWLPLLTIPATLNKESFLLFLPTLIPVFRARCGWRITVSAVGAACMLGAALNLIVKAHYAGNPGGPVEWHLRQNLTFFHSLWPYRRFDIFYGVLLPRGFNLINILLLIELVRRSWRDLPVSLRQSTLIALAMNVPLFIIFGFEDELRALSILYVPLAIMMAFYARRVLSEGFEHPIDTAPEPAIAPGV